MESIVAEANTLVSQGVKELILVAQDVTNYGKDIYGAPSLVKLLRELVKTDVEWLRLMYCYPELVTDELIEMIANEKKIAKYIDIPMQHVSNSVLKRMNRRNTYEDACNICEKLKQKGIALRTTFMVGFPGETEEDFEELKEFVRWAKFERMGAFAYSEEEGTYSANHYQDDIPGEVKQRRLDELMAIQQDISAELNASKVNQQLSVIIDREEGEYYVGRTEFDSPEVDMEVLIKKTEKVLNVGSFYSVRITDAAEFDLYA
jgi:ribosomal protein S12 methylthiotransferase